MQLNTLFDLQLTIFLLMLAGYILAKTGLLPTAARSALTNLVIYFILPCNILLSFMIEFNRQIVVRCLSILVISLLIQLVCFLAGFVLYPGVSAEKKASLRYATSVSNAGFIGLPIVQGLYGELGVLYASIYLIPQRIVMWSAGVSCFTGAKGKGVLKKILTHPCILAALVGMVLMVTQLELPSGIMMALGQASNATTALSMIIIGTILAEVDLRTLFDGLVLRYCAIRLLIFPAVVLVGCRLVGIDPLVSATAVILSGMPAAATTALLAEKYDCDSHFAVKLVCASTLLSLLTIPLLSVVMQHI